MSGQTSAYHYISGNAPHPDRPTVRRQNVLAILYSPSDDQFALLDREGYGRKSRIMGGTDGEDLIAAGKREIAEESGYTDLEYEKTLNNECHAEYFAEHKDINRYSIEHCVVFRLRSDMKLDGPLDDDHHRVVWLPRDEVEAFLSDVPGLSSNL
ncbi:NUDIX domain-containing protein, partial [Patescibacteria group bacterium]|nr:NUDIX domain-containing protein [Patescibacteria group bacterium]